MAGKQEAGGLSGSQPLINFMISSVDIPPRARPRILRTSFVPRCVRLLYFGDLNDFAFDEELENVHLPTNYACSPKVTFA